MAALVRRLNHSNSAPWEGAGSSKINIDAIQAAFSWFTSQTNSDTLVPRVKTISWDAHDNYPSSQLPYFISSCLQQLSFRRTSSSYDEIPGEDLERWTEIFTSLIKKQCQLIHLSFLLPWSISTSPSLQARFLEFASTQTQLRSIKLQDRIDEPLLQSMVGARNTLVSLTGSVSKGLGVTFGRTMEALSTEFSVLQELNVSITGGRLTRMTHEDFKQVQQIRSLRRVTFRTSDFPILGEADVEAMSQAWPDIEKFAVKLHRFSSIARHIQLLSILSAFARWMGSTIQILDLDLNATEVRSLRTADGFKFVKLRELHIGELAHRNALKDLEDEVAGYLRSLSFCGQSPFKLVIPNGTHETVNGSPPPLKGWQKVRYLLETGGVAAEEGHRS
ncbi:hypothetical protein M407DRAFT_157480 [Tulasnella calospora MUT 4182]|uniref:Uncharacterized protein n=1 Tax=Tulasnella calospora MUT 4182 TaxID=1051891 RepID=A0A0C3Q615_9AGAM|nr:hypothetical protein M407DRAFT_157480 [Tulasnella calospora MUT 4182]